MGVVAVADDVLDGFESQLNSDGSSAQKPVDSVNTGNGHVYGDTQTLDPGVIGQQLADQRAQFDTTITNLTTQHAEKLGGVNNEVAQLRAQLERLTQGMPQQAPEDPYAKYGLSEDERAEMEPFLSGVDKRAQAATEIGMQKVVNSFKQQIENERNAFKQQLDDLRSQINLTNSDSQQAFEASTTSVARSYGLDLNSLANDTEWNEFLKSKASHVSDETFYDVLSAGVKNRQLGTAERVFARFAEVRKTPANQLTGLPQGGNARGGMGNEGGGEGDPMVVLENKRKMILDKGREYRAQVDARTMSAQDFVEKVAALEQLEGQVMNQMNELRNSQGQSQTI